MNNHRYIFKDGEVVPEPDLMTWAHWLQDHETRIAATNIGPARISTVFLGLDHDFLGNGPRQIYETMIFDDSVSDMLHGDLFRYATLEEAQRGHRIMVERVREFRPNHEPVTESFELGTPRK